jgi:hypothetical protein
MMDTCRWEFVAIVLMALSGEGDEFEYKMKKEIDLSTLVDDDSAYWAQAEWMETYGDLEWYQTSF